MSLQPPPITSGDVTRQFDSWSDMIAWVMQHPKAIQIARDNVSNNSIDTWAGGTWDACQQLAVSGWREGAAKLRQFSERILSTVTPLIEREQWYMDVYSPYGTFDIGAVAAGLPEHAYNSTKVMERSHGTQIMHIVVNMACSGHILPAEIMLRGSAIAAFVEACELCGRRCQLDLVDSSRLHRRRPQRTLTYHIRVKEAQQPLDLALLTYQIAHPSVSRRWLFMLEDIDGANDCGYGSPGNVKVSSEVIYFPALDGLSYVGEYATEESTQFHVKELLRKHKMIGSSAE